MRLGHASRLPSRIHCCGHSDMWLHLLGRRPGRTNRVDHRGLSLARELSGDGALPDTLDSGNARRRGNRQSDDDRILYSDGPEPGVLADLELRLLPGDDVSSCDAMDAARRSGLVLLRHDEPLGLSSHGIDRSGSGPSSMGEIDRALLKRLLGETWAAQDIADLLL